MNEELSKKFQHVLQVSSELGGNVFLALLKPILDEVAEIEDEQLSGSIRRLCQLVGDQNMGLDEAATEEFIQELGEAHFYALCKKRNVSLQKLSTSNEKMPDFLYAGMSYVWLEVKTPSIRHGKENVKAAIEQSFDNRLESDKRLDAGQRVVVIEQEIAPYGHVVQSQRVTNAVCVLQQKIRNNLKAGQFSNKPTYLVCNLMMLGTYGIESELLRPVYASSTEKEYMSPVSGLLWMVAFSEPGMLVFSEPEFEGKPGIEGRFEGRGILVGDEFEYVDGIIFVVNNLDHSPRMFGLIRSNEELNLPISKLIGTSWNDRSDTNGWVL